MQTRRDIRGRYRLIRAIGEGGTGTVYQAADLLLGRPVAVKVLHDSSVPLRREGFSLAQVDHPGVVALHDLVEDGGRQYLVMEYVDGVTLETVLQERGTLGGERAVEMVRVIGGIVAQLHARGILHCDLKPANVLLSASGEIKLADFTLARLLRDGRFTGRSGGTAPYAAPEQLGGTVGPWTDVYALGMLLRRLAGPPTGHDETGRRLAAVVERATALDPRDRFPTVGELLSALPSVEDSTQLVAASPLGDLTRVLPERYTTSRPPLVRILSLLCAALAVTVAGISAHFTVLASPDRIPAPALAGTNLPAARLVLRTLDLRYRVVQRYAPVSAGTVLSEVPAAGTGLLRQGVITLVVSKGPRPVTVPALIGRPQSGAVETLRRLGLVVVVRTQDTISQPAGIVLAQEPAGVARLLPGSRVTITISTKPWWWIF